MKQKACEPTGDPKQGLVETTGECAAAKQELLTAKTAEVELASAKARILCDQ